VDPEECKEKVEEGTAKILAKTKSIAKDGPTKSDKPKLKAGGGTPPSFSPDPATPATISTQPTKPPIITKQ